MHGASPKHSTRAQVTAKSNTAPTPPAWEGRGIQRMSVGEDQSLLEPGCEVPAERYFPLGSPLGLVPSSYKDGWETTRPYAAQAACSRARPTKNHTSVSQETLLEANGHARSQRQLLMPEMPWTRTTLSSPQLLQVISHPAGSAHPCRHFLCSYSGRSL